MIPRIIHQTAPVDKSLWPEKWFECTKSWKVNFPEPLWRHVLWNDEDLDYFVSNNFSEFYPIYRKYPSEIQRVNMARYMILFKFGGIYADMDFECFTNFYDTLDQSKVNLAESPYKNNENLHNSLMASPQGHSFWLSVINNAKSVCEIPDVLTSTGPRLLDKTYEDNSSNVNILPYKFYNPSIYDSNEFNSNVFCRHFITSVWAHPGPLRR
jgi:mannosyltransferase OCH1-like enzyme